jgi:hypothetical protein
MSSLRARVGPAYLHYREQAERILHPSAFQVALVKFAVSQWWAIWITADAFFILPALSLRTAPGTLRFAMRFENKIEGGRGLDSELGSNRRPL